MERNYFHGYLRIPNLNGNAQANKGVQEKVDDLILDYEPEFLRMLLGKDLYDSYTVEGVFTLPNTLKAKIYDSSNWKSPAAGYVFFSILAEKFNRVNRIGRSANHS